jgi:hypothetical protein
VRVVLGEEHAAGVPAPSAAANTNIKNVALDLQRQVRRMTAAGIETFHWKVPQAHELQSCNAKQAAAYQQKLCNCSVPLGELVCQRPELGNAGRSGHAYMHSE